MKANSGFVTLTPRSFLASISFALLSVFPVKAELMGMVPGRGANVSLFANQSIEIGASWYTNQLQWSALRYNFKPSHSLTIYVDAAHLEASNLPLETLQNADFEGFGFGGGIVFSIPEKLTRFDVAFKGAYHSSSIAGHINSHSDSPLASRNYGSMNSSNVGNNNKQTSKQRALSLRQSQWSVGFVLSPIDPLFENGLTWYATLSYFSTQAQSSRAGSEFDGSTKRIQYRRKIGTGLGAGIIKPTEHGSVYAGFNWLSDNPLLGAGYRYVF